MHARDKVLASVRSAFSKSNRPRVLDLLDTYGIESYERERERVQLAILKLSQGSEEKLREYLAVAKRDYRDVLFWAEYPESRIDTPEKGKKCASCSRNLASTRRPVRWNDARTHER